MSSYSASKIKGDCWPSELIIKKFKIVVNGSVLRQEEQIERRVVSLAPSSEVTAVQH
jgi:hypothetical protein